MQLNQEKAIIEAILFSAGRPVTKSELMLALEITAEDVEKLVTAMQEEYNEEKRGGDIYGKNSKCICTCRT